MSPTEIESLLHTFTIGLGILLAALLYLIILIMLAKVMSSIQLLRGDIVKARLERPSGRAASSIKPLMAMPAAKENKISTIWRTDETSLKAE